MIDKADCPLCGRELPDKPSRHHLIPRSLKGREIVLLHRICHRQIHATFTERELFKYYNTIDKIQEHDGIKKFIRWIKDKPPEFHVKTKTSSRKKIRK